MTLIRFEAARRALEEARTIDEVKDIRDKAEALRLYTKQAGESLEMQNAIAEIKLRAERRAGELLKEIERIPIAERRWNTGSVPDRGFEETIHEAGISQTTAKNWQQIASLPEEKFEQEIAETKAAGDELTSAGMLRAVKDFKRLEKIQANEAARAEFADVGRTTQLDGRVQLECADFRDYLSLVEENSVDLIFTDPPYDSDSIDLFDDLAYHASKILKPGGSLLTYCGHYAIPEVTALMGQHLRYWWIIALSHQSGNHQRLEGKKVYVHWKPVLWYVKETYRGVRAVADLTETVQPEKKLQDWEQDINAVQYYIEYLTDPNDLVVDPMCGAGTICKAAYRTGRRSIGIEIDPERFAVAKANIGGFQQA